jgi:hypothetical protein
VRRREVEGQAAHGDDGDAPGLKFLKGVQQVEGAAAPAGQLRDEDRVNLAPLGERHNLASLGTVGPRAGSRLAEGADHLVAGACGERGEVPLLPLAGLVGGRDRQ